MRMRKALRDMRVCICICMRSILIRHVFILARDLEEGKRRRTGNVAIAKYYM